MIQRVERLDAFDLERAQRLRHPEQRHPQRLAPRRVPDQPALGVADDVGIHLVLAEMLVVQQVVLAERHGAREGEREVAQDAQIVVVRLVAEHEVVGAFVDQDVERVIDERAEQIGGNEDPQPRHVAEQVRRQPLHRDQADHPQGGRRVLPEQLADLGVPGEDLARPLPVHRMAVQVGEFEWHELFRAGRPGRLSTRK